MAVTILSSSLQGLEANIVYVEVDVSRGLRSFTIVGLPDKAVEEAKERVTAGLMNSRLPSPRDVPRRVTINLAPASIRKAGPAFDLAIAIGFLHALEPFPEEVSSALFLGELSLHGSVRGVSGVLAALMHARDQDRARFIRTAFVPKENQAEAALVASTQLSIFPVESIEQLVLHLRGDVRLSPLTKTARPQLRHALTSQPDFADIKGQELAKRAAEIAAAGFHNLLLSGPPGGGKSMIAQALPGILPTLRIEELLEVTKIYSAAGDIQLNQPAIITHRPFRAPHHGASDTSILGGGSIPRPGEITLAHRGVLFLDELAEFKSNVLEALRQPLEDRRVRIARAHGRYTFPADVLLVAATNPCPCGFFGDPQKSCSCSPAEVGRYERKLSGPLLDRIDLFADVRRLGFNKLTDATQAESSADIRKRVTKAHAIQQQRFGTSLTRNASMDAKHIKQYCMIDTQTRTMLKKAVEAFHLSPRAYFRVLRVARTIADLEAQARIESRHVSEAIQYRQSISL